VSAATGDKGLTPFGQQRAVARALANAAEQLRKYSAAEDRASAALVATRAEALTAWTGDPEPDTVREIRATIRAEKIDPIQVGANLVGGDRETRESDQVDSCLLGSARGHLTC
jgi:hypothetical protein